MEQSMDRESGRANKALLPLLSELESVQQLGNGCPTDAHAAYAQRFVNLLLSCRRRSAANGLSLSVSLSLCLPGRLDVACNKCCK